MILSNLTVSLPSPPLYYFMKIKTALVRNEEVKYYTLTAQVLTKIIFYNLLPKSGEYSHTRGSAPLLIYYLLKGIRVIIPKLIINFMLSKHLLIPNWHLPFGMLISWLLKLLKFNLSTVRSIAPSIDINNTLVKRMHVGERAPAPVSQPPPTISAVVPGSSSTSVDPYSALSAQLQAHDLKITTQLEKMSAHHKEIQQGFQNDLTYICSSIRYLQTCVDENYGRHTCLFLFRVATTSVFHLWVFCLINGYLLQLLLRHRHLLKIQTIKKSEPLLCWWQKGGELSEVI